MSSLETILARHGRERSAAIAVSDLVTSLSYGELTERLRRSVQRLRDSGCLRIALFADNGIDWIVADLASLFAGVTVIPIPPFFSARQQEHVIGQAGIDGLLIDESWWPDALADGYDLAGTLGRLQLLRRRGPVPRRHRDAVAKITFTSGSTGQPKGVCLGREGLERSAASVAAALRPVGVGRHLNVMPLSLLLENVAGVYAPLILGASVIAPPVAAAGLRGSSDFDAAALRGVVSSCGAQSLILLPQMLRELTRSVAARPWPGNPLCFVAVGGARVSDADLGDARRAGIPACQGYGLSECNSVIALNRPGAERAGSVGKPLPGVDVRIASDGEILVRGPGMIGYLGDEPDERSEVATGDLGHLDQDGFLYVTGRKKNVFITSFGRNVSPEWPEAELLHEPEVAQAIVHGEGMPVNTAVIVPADAATGSSALESAVKRCNARLPDYARVSHWIVAEEPFSVQNGMLTPTGKPRREAVIRRYLAAPTPNTLQLRTQQRMNP